MPGRVEVAPNRLHESRAKTNLNEEYIQECDRTRRLQGIFSAESFFKKSIIFLLVLAVATLMVLTLHDNLETGNRISIHRERFRSQTGEEVTDTVSAVLDAAMDSMDYFSFNPPMGPPINDLVEEAEQLFEATDLASVLAQPLPEPITVAQTNSTERTRLFNSTLTPAIQPP